MEIAKGRQAEYGSPPHIPRGSPIRVSPCVSYLLPTHTSPSQDPSTSTLDGLHPSLEGRGQVAASLGAWGLKKDEIGQQIYNKRDLNEVLTFFNVSCCVR
jgi:hypothetical protein